MNIHTVKIMSYIFLYVCICVCVCVCIYIYIYIYLGFSCLFCPKIQPGFVTTHILIRRVLPGMKLTSHFYLLSGLGMHGAIPPVQHMCWWRGSWPMTAQLYFYPNRLYIFKYENCVNFAVAYFSVLFQHLLYRSSPGLFKDDFTTS